MDEKKTQRGLTAEQGIARMELWFEVQAAARKKFRRLIAANPEKYGAKESKNGAIRKSRSAHTRPSVAN